MGNGKVAGVIMFIGSIFSFVCGALGDGSWGIIFYPIGAIVLITSIYFFFFLDDVIKGKAQENKESIYDTELIKEKARLQAQKELKKKV